MTYPDVMERDSINTDYLSYSSSVCDIASICCVLPCVGAFSCCSGGPYSAEFPPPDTDLKTKSPSKLDRWYRSAIHTLHGGSLLQLLATHSVYWKFPLVSKKNNYSLHEVQVAPRTQCGKHCFVPLVRGSKPYFRIQETKNGVLSVRLTATMCGVGDPVQYSAFTLNDVWKVSEDGRFVRSMKTRNHRIYCQHICVTGVATGPAYFIAADDLPTRDEIVHALVQEF